MRIQVNNVIRCFESQASGALTSLMLLPHGWDVSMALPKERKRDLVSAFVFARRICQLHNDRFILFGITGLMSDVMWRIEEIEAIKVAGPQSNEMANWAMRVIHEFKDYQSSHGISFSVN